MNIYEYINSQSIPRPWIDDSPIDCHSLYVQDYLLKLQLNSIHDKGSRKTEDIKLHVDWLDTFILKNKVQIVDLGCGPGFYSHYFSEKGHFCDGMDISKLAIDYAHKTFANNRCHFEQGNYLDLDFAKDKYDLAFMSYSNFNTIHPSRSANLLGVIRQSLRNKGQFYLEALSYIEPIKEYVSHWQLCDQPTIFCHKPHLIISEQYWHSEVSEMVYRCHIFDADQNGCKTFVTTQKFYDHDSYKEMFQAVGFDDVIFINDIPGTHKGDDKAYIAMLATC